MDKTTVIMLWYFSLLAFFGIIIIWVVKDSKKRIDDEKHNIKPKIQHKRFQTW